MAYIYRREDSGELVEVDFSTMLTQDAIGCITLPDGATARRCVYLERERDGHDRAVKREELNKPIISDALGFTAAQFNDFEQDRVKNGFRGVEFVRDPLEPTFYQVKVSTPGEWERYVKHRGMLDRNGKNGGGATLTPAQMERIKERVIEELDKRSGIVHLTQPGQAAQDN